MVLLRAVGCHGPPPVQLDHAGWARTLTVMSGKLAITCSAAARLMCLIMNQRDKWCSSGDPESIRNS